MERAELFEEPRESIDEYSLPPARPETVYHRDRLVSHRLWTLAWAQDWPDGRWVQHTLRFGDG